MTLGPVMLDLEGTEVSDVEREILQHPVVGGVILFSRNYEHPEQLAELTGQIHALRRPSLIVAIDQEGGRVQRCKNGFTELPAVHRIGRLYDIDQAVADEVARSCGWLMAAELRGLGVDLSFAPVLDLDRGVSEVIGDRAFHRDPEVVSRLAGRYCSGMRAAGMVATGKHFPGHGAVVADSHVALPEDHRAYADILEDMLPYERLIPTALEAVMVAHVVYSNLDPRPAGYSSWWLTSELRERMRFQGVVFSDDLTMAGAAVAGSPQDRAQAALEAGCDMVLVCNDRDGALAVVESLENYNEPPSQVRLARLHGKGSTSLEDLQRIGAWTEARRAVDKLFERPDLTLDG